MAQEGEGKQSGRCCWGYSTMRVRCSMWASARASRTRSGGSWSSSLRPIAKNALENHPWKDWAEPERARPGSACRGAKPLEPGQGFVMGAVAAGVGGRGGI